MSRLPIRVLMVDDDEDDFIVARDLIASVRDCEIQLEWVSAFEDATADMDRLDHDVYLIDYRLGAHSGLELLRDNPKATQSKAVILLTGAGQSELDSEALRHGAADYLEKSHLTAPLLVKSIRYVAERVRIMEYLRATNETLRSLIDVSPLGVCVIDNRHTVTLWNPASEKVFGWSAAEVLGKPLPGAHDGGDDDFARLVTSGFQGHALAGFEIRAARKDGSEVDVNLWTAPLNDQRGRTSSVMAMAVDVTEQRQAQHALRSSEEFHRALSERSADIILVSNVEGIIRYASPSCQRVLGYTPDQLVDRVAFDFVHPEDIPAVQSVMESIWAHTREPMTLRVRFRNRIGDYRVIEGIGARISIESIPEGIVLNARDVTDRVTAEELAHRLAAAVEQVSESIMITDTEGRILYANPAFAHLTGMDCADIVGQSTAVLCSVLTPAPDTRGLVDAVASGVVWSGTFGGRHRLGRACHVECTVAPIRDSNGRVINYVSVARDVTEERVREAHLRQSQRLEAIGSLASGIAHEINTPIQFIGDNVHFLASTLSELLPALQELSKVRATTGSEGNIGDSRRLPRDTDTLDLDYVIEEIPRALNQTREGIDRVISIVKAMREFAHPGGHGEHRTEIDLNRALEGALTVCRNQIKNVADVRTDFDVKLPPIPCYANELNQVFLNLLINAAQAIQEVYDKTGDRGWIAVRTVHENGSALVAIGDTGSGISESAREHIFEPFFTTKPVGRGTGQGLAIARSVIVDKHKGSITFDTVEGSGTTFYVRLPFIPKEKETEHEPAVIRR